MTSEVMSAQHRAAAAIAAANAANPKSSAAAVPHVTTVSIRDSDAAILSSVYRLSTEILHHKWLLRQR